MANNITIKDVAKMAGVSASTVSRALNGNVHVDEKLKDKVLSAVQELGYMPNDVARSLKMQDSSLVAYVVSNTADPFFTSISRGIEDVLFDNGYSLINCSTNFSIEREACFLNMLAKRRVAGIVINTVGNNDKLIAGMSRRFPTVLSNRLIRDHSFVGDFVDFDNISGVMRLTKHLLELGHRRIAFLTGPEFLSTVEERFAGFRMAMLSAGISIDDDYPYVVKSSESYTANDGYKGIAKLMSMRVPPTAVVASNSEMALGVMRYCREHSLSIPDSISLCSFGNLLNHDLMYVDVTHTSMDLFAIGNRMAQLLLDRIASGNAAQPNREIRFDSPLVTGNSTAEYISDM